MSSSIVEIWNVALVRIGHTPVEDENEISAEANILRAVWTLQRDRMLEGFDWDFARRFGALTKITDETEVVDNWQFAYEWPQGDVLMFRGIPDPLSGNSEPIPYDVMLRASGDDRKIMTDLDAANGYWTERIIDPTRYSAAFEYALSFALQGEVVGAIRKDDASQVRAAQFLKAAVEEAEKAVANQGVPRTPEDTNPRSIAARA